MKEYAHEEWPNVSNLIWCYKNRLRNRYWRVHEHKREVCLTQSQAYLYDLLLTYREEDDTIDVFGNSINFNAKAMMNLIDKHKLFTIKNGILHITKD